MGYMGFGMKKEVYTRKPRKAFSRLKKVYKNELNNRGGAKTLQGATPEFEEADRLVIRNRIRQHYRRRNIKAALITISIPVLLIILLWIFSLPAR